MIYFYVEPNYFVALYTHKCRGFCMDLYRMGILRNYGKGKHVRKQN